MEEDYSPFLSSSQDKTDEDLLDSKVDFDSLIAELRDLESQSKISVDEMVEKLLALHHAYRHTDISDKEYEPTRYANLIQKTRGWFGPELSNIFDKMGVPLGERWLLGTALGEITRSCGPTELFFALKEALPLVTPEATAVLNDLNLKEVASGINPNRAIFLPATNTIGMNLEKEPLDPLNILLDLYQLNYSSGMRALLHEYTHYLQGKNAFAPKNRTTDVVPHFDQTTPEGINQNIITETHAHQAQYSSIGRYLTTHEILSRVQGKDYKFEDNAKNVEKIITANHQIRQLQVLGGNDPEVATIVGLSRWDETAGKFDLVDSVNKAQMEKRGMDEEDVEEQITAEEIKRKILVEKMRLAIQKVVLSARS